MTKSDDKRVPALRFKGFTDEWEQRKLGDLTQKIKSYPISHDAEINTITGTKYIHYGDIHTGKLKRITNEKILPNINDNNYIPLKSGDVIVADASEDYKGIADACVIDLMKEHYKIVSGLHTIVFRPNERLKSDFLYTYFHTPIFKHYGYRVGTGLKVFGITYNNLSNMEIKLPKIDEQNKVYKIINIVTNIITLQQRKLRQLKLLKNALLKRMFTAKKSPTLRFRDFSKDWKLHKLQDITDRLDNARVPVTASKRIAGSTPYYGANGIQDYVKGYTHDGEFLLVAEDGANNINDYPVICAKGKIWVNNHTHVLQAKNKKIDILFLMYALKFLNMKKYLVGGGRSKLNAETMMKLALKLPELDEEHNIGVLIKNMDVLITQYKYRIQKINKFKQFLLQNMFI